VKNFILNFQAFLLINEHFVKYKLKKTLKYLIISETIVLIISKIFNEKLRYTCLCKNICQQRNFVNIFIFSDNLFLKTITKHFFL